MEILTKYNRNDKVYFLTTDTELNGNENWYPKQNEVFICEGKIKKIKIDLDANDIDIIYVVVVWSRRGDKWVEVREKMCSPDIQQLGVDVSNTYEVNKLKL